MKKFKVVTDLRLFYEVEANNEEEALKKVLEGKIKPSYQEVLRDEVIFKEGEE